MRKIGEFVLEKDALKFWSFLKEQGIDSSLEEEEEGEKNKWSIWVAEEERINQAQREFADYSKNPDAAKYATPKDLQQHQKKERSAKRKSVGGFKEINLREKWYSREQSVGIFTLSLITASVAVYLISGMGGKTELVGFLFISEKLDGRLSEFFSGQIWRVITPIFLHFTFLHIAFNMYWLYEFGSQIERKKGTKHFVTFILVIALISNLAQYLANGPSFGGMSGVVYGLFGYIWIKSRFDPGDGFFIDSFVSILMFGYFVICFAGIAGPVANLAHAGGLVVGLAWGYGSALKWNLGKS